METISTQEIMSLMEAARFDAAGQLRNVIRRTNEIVDQKYRLVDPTSPLVFLMEMACVGAANTAIQHEAETRRRYPMLALSKADLYFHMTDRHYLGAFAVPPQANIGVVIPLEEIIQAASEVGTTGVKLLTLPKNSVWTVNGIDFTLEHPIDFKVMPDGGVVISFSTPSIEALHPVETNIIETEYIQVETVRCLRFKIPVKQMTITTSIERINRATTNLSTIRYDDKFHYLRAYVRRTVNGVRKWVEIRTTHTEHQYDPYYPTVLVRDNGGEISLTIPAIYQSSNMLGDDIRLDLYTTKAENDVLLGDFSVDRWLFEARDIDEENSQYTSKFSRLSTMISFSDDFTKGGRDELTFEALRERIMDVHYGSVAQPITTVNHAMTLKDHGYETVKAIDNTTRREFNATRNMPLPSDGSIVSPINVGVFNTLLRVSDIQYVDGVLVNGDRCMIRPDVLFKYVDGSIVLVNNSEKDWLTSLSVSNPELFAKTISDNRYLFTPFYYLLDASLESFELRAYSLDSPTTDSRQYITTNDTLSLDLQTAQAVGIRKVNAGYVITLVTNSGDTYRNLRDDQVGVQLSYTPEGTNRPFVILGTMAGKDENNNRIFEFTLRSNHDINNTDEIMLLDFIMAGDGPAPKLFPLLTKMDICYFVNDYPIQSYRRSSMEDLINQSIVPYNTYGILQESVKVRFGDRIENLWTGARSIVLPEDYETYDHDMPRTYETVVYERDVNGELVVEETPNGLVVHKIHDIGDPVIDEVTGLPEYVYRVGDHVLVNGLPVVKNPRKLTRQLDLVLFDGVYRYATDRVNTSYVEYVTRSIIEWSNVEIADINKTALDETAVKFRPIATAGTIGVVVNDGVEIDILAEQSLYLEVYMTESGWKNEQLKEGLRVSIIKTITDIFSRDAISTKVIINELSLVLGTEVMGVSLSGLGGKENNYPLITIKDGSGRLSLRKKLTSLPNLQYTVEEDIEISFVPHFPARSDR